MHVLVSASPWLQGNRDNIDGMASGSQKVLTQVLKLVDAHDLVSAAYGAGQGRAGQGRVTCCSV